MAPVTKYKPLYPWTGGLVTSVDATIVDPQNLIQADNIQFTNSGSRRKRGGSDYFNTAAIQVGTAATGVQSVIYMTPYWATVANAKREYFVAVTTGGKVWRTTPASHTWASCCTLTLSVTQGGVTSTVINNDLVLGIKNSGVPKMWDAQNTSTNFVALTASSGSLPFASAWILVNYLERLWVAGDKANPDRVYVSRVGDHQRWTASSAAGTAITLDVGIGDGDPGGITALIPGPAGDRALYAMKRRHIYRIDCSNTNQYNWTVTRLSNEIGCINPNAWAYVDQSDVMFLSDRGLHSLGQTINQIAITPASYLSFPIQTDYLSIIDSSTRDNISLVYDADLNCVLFNCKRVSQSVYDTIYGYNVELKAWFRWTGLKAQFLCTRLDKGNGKIDLYSCGNVGFVYQLKQDDRNDVGAAIHAILKSSFIAPESVPIWECQYTNLAMFYRARDNSDIRVTYSVDGLNSKAVTFEQKYAGGGVLNSGVLGVMILGDIESMKPVWNHLAIESGNALQLTIEHDTVDKDMEIFGLVLEYQIEEEAANAFTSSAYS